MIALSNVKCWTQPKKSTPPASLPWSCIPMISLKLDQMLSGCTVKQIRKLYAWEIPQKKPLIRRWRWSLIWLTMWTCRHRCQNRRSAHLEVERDNRNSFYRGNTQLSCFKMTMKPQSKDRFTAHLSFSELSCNAPWEWLVW